MFVRKGMYVRHFYDDGRGGGYVYGMAVTNGDRKPRIRWENGKEQVVSVHSLEIVAAGDISDHVLHRLRPNDLAIAGLRDAGVAPVAVVRAMTDAVAQDVVVEEEPPAWWTDRSLDFY